MLKTRNYDKKSVHLKFHSPACFAGYRYKAESGSMGNFSSDLKPDHSYPPSKEELDLFFCDFTETILSSVK